MYGDRRVSQLAQQLCGPLYRNNTSLSASVAAALESATAAAAAHAVASTGFATHSNASVTGAVGTPMPSAFTGGASVGGVGVAVVLLAGSIGALCFL